MQGIKKKRTAHTQWTVPHRVRSEVARSRLVMDTKPLGTQNSTEVPRIPSSA